ncbi:hypothetical protein MPK64_gp287 [Erwinia phage pEa_SNUABM_16]|uniref:Uncharacterized protein n=1 Tax=Erwinia phage pEa_SNUABM_16 TaxID=2869544 RepID=A0AAE9BUR3_9CAUD|nr:hypothetical protein MPK64_gp287 [Erwinia phage pEa_SNUABM_16]UAW96431.1 hypothetical protein pEaSNUABM16_00287 [Erwinia phage pEa_SNUABM_16]
MNTTIQFLMDENEIEDALTSYHTDPTDENKRRVIETILSESKHAPKPDIEPEAHRIIFVPSVTTLRSEPAVTQYASFSGEIDKMLMATAKLAKRVVDKIHEAGSSAVFVRFDPEEWYSYRIPILWGFYDLALEAKTLDGIDSSMRDLMRKVGNLPFDEDVEDFYGRINRYVTEGEHEGCLRSITQMVDTKFTRNLPQTETEEEGEEE